MDGEVEERLLAKYLAGECSEEEAERVRAWISQEPGAAERMARLQQIWKATDAPTSSWNAEGAWGRLQKRIQKEQSAPDSTSANQEQDRSEKRSRRKQSTRSSRSHLFRTAAVGLAVLALALVATLVGKSISLSVGEAEAKVFTANKGQQSTVRLADGSKVRLNVDSRLTVPESFKDRREVRLKGEAYFDVVGDSTRPFIVDAEDATIQVLGTAFNVRSYTGDEKTRVAVTEGKVELQAKRSRGRSPENKKSSAVLLPRSLALASEEGLEAVHEDVELSGEVAWTEGKLVFEDAPFEEVIRKLERWYDIDVEASIPVDEIVGLNATFEEAPLDEVLRSIGAALNLQYRKNKGGVTFYR